MRSVIPIFLLIFTAALGPAPARAEFDLSLNVINGRIVPSAYDDDEEFFAPRQYVFGYNFGEDPQNPLVIDDPGVSAFTWSGLSPGSLLGFDFRTNLRYWMGAGAVQFTAVPSGESLTLSGTSGSATADASTGFQPGFTIATVAFGGSFHRHLESTLNAGAEQATPAEGIYLAQIQLRNSDPFVKNSLPIFLLYNNGLDELTAFTDAQDWVQENYVPFGDFSRDSEFTNADILAMLHGLTNLDAYRATHGLLSEDLLAYGDMNGDGDMTHADIQPLLDLLAEGLGTGSAMAVPEPAAWLPLAMGAVAMLVARRHNRGR